MGGCSTSKEELSQMQKKMQLKGESGNLAEAGNIIKLPKGGVITPTSIGIYYLRRTNSIRDAS
jgi:predicted mannosyl-3-phosphoglycerate phosphatase (HAD superfamily)